MKQIYLDNAATTCLDPEVLESMMPFLTTHFGNPSSGHMIGRDARLAVEKARNSIAGLLQAHPTEIFFTSGGTESNNTAIQIAIQDLHCGHIITSPIEHHAVLHTVEALAKKNKISFSLVNLLPDGHIDLGNLEAQLKKCPQRCLVSLMHANNEIGNLTDLQSVGKLCERYNAIFHADCVQTVGHYPLNLRSLGVHFIAGSAHKFHGPKGAGILYIKKGTLARPLIIGGDQENKMRGGTENVAGIVGFARALALAMSRFEKDFLHMQSLKTYLLESLRSKVNGIRFHGDAEGQSLYSVLNAGIPKTPRNERLLGDFDLNNIFVSGGSACSTGRDSHVISAIKGPPVYLPIRFSFSKYNTKQDLDAVIDVLRSVEVSQP